MKSKKNTTVIPNGSHVKIKHIGTVRLKSGLTLNKVLYVPKLQYIMISLRKLCQDRNAKVNFFANIRVMQGPLVKPLLLGRMRNNFYYVEEKWTFASFSEHT